MIWFHIAVICVLWGIRLIFNYKPSFMYMIPVLAYLLFWVWRKEGRTILLVCRCAGRWNLRRHSYLRWYLPWLHRLCRLGYWWQRSYTSCRHLIWIIPTRSCVCSSPTWGSHQLSSWYASHFHESLGINCVNPCGPWCGSTGCYGNSWTRRSRFVWGAFPTADWWSLRQ